MHPDLRERIEKIEKEIDKFTQLSDAIKEQRYTSLHLREYARLIEDCRKILKANLEKHLRTLLDPLKTEEEKDAKLADFRSPIKRLFDFFYRLLATSQKVPRELYYLSDTFLESQGQPAHYIISISEEIAMLPFSYIISYFGFDITYPEFWAEAKDKRFYFVQVVPELADREASLNWPIIIHEMAHIIWFERMIKGDKYFPSISVYHALKTIESLDKGELGPDEPIVELATQKLYAAEILADFLVARYFGAIFGWRFLVEYVDLRDLFEPDRTHPYPDVRVLKVSNEVRDQLGMSECAKFLEQEIKTYQRKVSRRVKKRGSKLDLSRVLSTVDKELQTLIAETRKDKRNALTYEKIKQALRDSPWFRTPESRAEIERKLQDKNFYQFLKQLHKDIIGGKPIVVEPSVVYFLLTLDFSAVNEIPVGKTLHERRILELVADLIRLYAVQRRVSKSKSTS